MQTSAAVRWQGRAGTGPGACLGAALLFRRRAKLLLQRIQKLKDVFALGAFELLGHHARESDVIVLEAPRAGRADDYHLAPFEGFIFFAPRKS
jgi:hypothetical protein